MVRWPLFAATHVFRAVASADGDAAVKASTLTARRGTLFDWRTAGDGLMDSIRCTVD